MADQETLLPEKNLRPVSNNQPRCVNFTVGPCITGTRHVETGMYLLRTATGTVPRHRFPRSRTSTAGAIVCHKQEGRQTAARMLLMNHIDSYNNHGIVASERMVSKRRTVYGTYDYHLKTMYWDIELLDKVTCHQ